MPLIWKISIGFIVGIILGFIIGPVASESKIIGGVVLPSLDVIGKIFLAMLKMLIVPLVFASIITGAASIGDPKVLGRIGVKTIVLYLSTTVVAIIFGLILGNIIQPGVGLSIEGAAGEAKAAAGMVDVLLGRCRVGPSLDLSFVVFGGSIQDAAFSLGCVGLYRDICCDAFTERLHLRTDLIVDHFELFTLLRQAQHGLGKITATCRINPTGAKNQMSAASLRNTLLTFEFGAAVDRQGAGIIAFLMG